MRSSEKRKRGAVWAKSCSKWVLWGFFLPFLLECGIVGIAFAVGRIGVTASDCFEQYIPFFSVYYDKWKEGGSLFYSWNGSMGFDFWNVFAYYLASPLNLLILLFPKRAIVYVVNLLILFKVALCGGTFSWYLQRKFPEQSGWAISLFGLLFAFSGFFLGYCWNVMWLDSIVLFPLLMAASDDLVEKKKPYAYCILLAAVIVLNYFIGYLICIYIFLSFWTRPFPDWKSFFASLIRIGVYSLLGVGMSAVILLPSFLGLTSTAISREVLPEMELYGSFGNVFATMGSFCVPVGISFDRERANLYTGEFVLLLMFVYVCCGRVRTREKIQKLILLAVLIVSCNVRPLNFLWHGFHEQSGIPNRFSFIAIFLILEMAYEAYVRRKDISKKEIRIAFAAYAAAMLALAFAVSEGWYHFVGAIAIGGFYCRLFAIHKEEEGAIRHAAPFLVGEAAVMYGIALVQCLGVFTGNYAEQADAFEQLTSAKEEGAYREKLDPVQNETELEWEEFIQNPQWEQISLEQILEQCENLMNMGYLSVMNEASIYGLHSMTLFNTFNNANLSRFYEKIGGEGSKNYVGYKGENSFMDMILGVRYSYNRYHRVNSFAYRQIAASGDVTLYENQYALPVAYAIPERLWKEESLLQDNPFATMNQISRNVTGESVYALRPFVLEEYSGCEKDRFHGTYGYFTDFVPQEAQVVFSYEAQEAENLVIQICCGEMYRAECLVNGETVFSGECHKQMIDLGQLEKNDRAEIVVSFSQEYDKAGVFLYAAALNQEAMCRVYDVLSRQQMEVEQFEEDFLSGTITITEPSAPVLVTIPYKKGWSIWVDKTEVPISEDVLWGGVFPVVELSEGTHELVFSYVSPMFYPGLSVSAASAALFFSAAACSKRKERKMIKNL